MKLPIYQVDAFASKAFAGNPAAVCPLEEWLDDALLQQIAAENNLSETAFFVPTATGFHIRWFTPKAEVVLCGHATLATAYVLFELLNYSHPTIEFQSKSGILTVTKQGAQIALNFPADVATPVEITKEITNCLPIQPTAAYRGKTDLLLVFENEEQVRNMQPDFAQIAQLPGRGVIITAPGMHVDFVSRFFGPQVGINEDPVTGSAHTILIPYWADKLNKSNLTAKQVSERGGDLTCSLLGDRVEIAGEGRLYLVGEIYI